MLTLLFACTPESDTLTGQPEPAPDTAEASDTDTDTPTDSGGGEDTASADRWSIEVGPIPDSLAAQMEGTTMHAGCPVGLDELVLLQPAHWDMAGAVQVGQLVVVAEAAQPLSQVFEALFRAGFAIHTMQPASAFGGSDDESMAADNTSAFNCRAVTGGSSWSEHSYGTALDLNPIENPYVSGSLVLPPEGADYTDRSDVRPGMVVEGDAVTAAFDAIGWGWGGRWSSLKDYQHFSESGQ
ncbi:MAG: hypothetical protein ACI8RZ_000342 [Myxococcota bacterium]|jgi:hypothetical protein